MGLSMNVGQVIPEKEPVQAGPFGVDPEPDQIGRVIGKAGDRQAAGRENRDHVHALA